MSYKQQQPVTRYAKSKLKDADTSLISGSPKETLEDQHTSLPLLSNGMIPQ